MATDPAETPSVAAAPPDSIWPTHLRDFNGIGDCADRDHGISFR